MADVEQPVQGESESSDEYTLVRPQSRDVTVSAV